MKKTFKLLNLYVNEYHVKNVRDYEVNRDHTIIEVKISDIECYDLADVVSMDLCLNCKYKPIYIDSTLLVLANEKSHINFTNDNDNNLVWAWLLSGVISAEIQK